LLGQDCYLVPGVLGATCIIKSFGLPQVVAEIVQAARVFVPSLSIQDRTCIR